MARVHVVVPDLMLNSRISELMKTGGHELTSRDDAEVLVVDVMDVEPEGVPIPGVRSLGVFAHTQPDARQRALDAGFDLVVPRSRIVREGVHLVDQLAPGT